MAQHPPLLFACSDEEAVYLLECVLADKYLRFVPYSEKSEE